MLMFICKNLHLTMVKQENFPLQHGSIVLTKLCKTIQKRPFDMPKWKWLISCNRRMSGDHEHVRICGPWNGRTAWCEIQEHQVQDQSASVPPLPCDNPA